MSFLDRLLTRARDRSIAPALQTQVLQRPAALPVIEPLQTPLPTQIGGISPMLPMQTITLPGGQTVQIPQFDMEEVNANLLAAGITPQVPAPAVTPTTVAPTISPLDEALTNPRGDFMSIERMPSVDLPNISTESFLSAPGTDTGPITGFTGNQAQTMPGGPPRSFSSIADEFDLPDAPAPVATPAPKPMRPEDASQTNPDGTPYATVGAGGMGAKLERMFDIGTGSSPITQLAPEGSMNPNLDTLQPVVEGNFFGDNTTPPAATTPAPVVRPDLPITNFPMDIPPPAPPPAPAVTTPAVEQPLAPYTGAQASPEDMPFVPSVRQVATGLDPLTEQLLFGIGGQGGFIPGAMQAAEKTFFNPDGTPRVIDEQVAGFTPDQLRAAELARQGVGVQDRFIEGAEGAFGSGIDALGRGFGRARGFAGQGLEATRAGLGDLTSGLSEQERISRGATGQFGQRLGGLGRQAMRSTADFGGRLGESESLLRGTTGAYDPSLTSAFFDPFEDRVVQQTISDVLEQGSKADIAARAGDIGRGGESAFGSRARLGASERQEALGRGLGEAISGIRSRGFTEAQRMGTSEFARQKAAERAASSGLAGLSASRLGAAQQLGGTLRGLSADQLAAQQGLAGTLGALGAQRFGGQQALAGALTGLGGMESQLAQREQAAQFGLGSALQGLGAQAQGAQATDIAQLYGMGTQQQALSQAQLDAQRRNQIQAQQAPLAQYQALAPFVSMAPAGQFQTVTDFAPPPSAMQVGIGTGLSTLGALGNLYGGRLMAISRAQIPEQIDVFANGGDTSTPSSLTPEDIISIYGSVQSAPVTAADIQAQQAQMAGLFPQPRKANFFDLASEVGAGLVAGAAAPGGFGVGLTAGLQSFNEVAQKRRAEADKIRQEMAVLAYKQVEAQRQEQIAQSKEILQMQFKAALEGQGGADFGGSERGKALAFIVAAERNPALKTVPDENNPGKMKPNPEYVISLLLSKQERIVQTETGQIRIPGIDIESAFDSAGVVGPKVLDGKTYTPVPGQTEKGTGKQIYEDSDGNKVVLD